MEAVDDGDWWVVGGQDEEVLFPRGPECPFVFFFPGEPMEVASILRTCLSSERVVTMRRKILSASSCWPNATQASPYASSASCFSMSCDRISVSNCPPSCRAPPANRVRPSSILSVRTLATAAALVLPSHLASVALTTPAASAASPEASWAFASAMATGTLAGSTFKARSSSRHASSCRPACASISPSRYSATPRVGTTVMSSV